MVIYTKHYPHVKPTQELNKNTLPGKATIDLGHKF